MNFYDFVNLVWKHQNSNTLPNNLLYPKELILDSKIWNYIINLYKFTTKFNYEHSITFYWVDNDIIATNPVKGTQFNVLTKEKIELKYIPKIREWYEKIISSNAICLGLVTNEFHLACKTKNTGTVLTHNQTDSIKKINYTFLCKNKLNTDDLNNLGIVFYRGSFKKKLFRIN